MIPSTFYTKGFNKEERRRGRDGRRGRGRAGAVTQKETVRGADPSSQLCPHSITVVLKFYFLVV